MEEQRKLLEEMIETGINYNEILRQSQVVDEYIVKHYRKEHQI